MRFAGAVLGLALTLGVAMPATAQTDTYTFPPDVVTPDAAAAWRELETGLDVAHFDSRSGRRCEAARADLTVLRVEPHIFELKIFHRGKGTDATPLNLGQWCEQSDLVAAINAGMFQADGRTHVGFSKSAGQVINGFANDYLSAAAFGPHDPADPPFRIFDLDETPLNEILARYDNVLQNLRLIKREGENRWQPSNDQWRETALAEDRLGRALLIFCRTPWSMARFNRILLELPLAIVAAQHLEGRYQAQLRINHPDYEGGPEHRSAGPVVPNILGIARRFPTTD